MVNLTLSIPKELHKFIKKHKEIKWSEVARSAMARYAEKLKLAERLVSKSRLTEEEAFELGELIKRKVWKKHVELGL